MELQRWRKVKYGSISAGHRQGLGRGPFSSSDDYLILILFPDLQHRYVHTNLASTGPSRFTHTVKVYPHVIELLFLYPEVGPL